MQDTTVAARYAQALFIVTEKRGETRAALDGPEGHVGGRWRPARRRRSTARHRRRCCWRTSASVLRERLEGRVLPIVAVFIDLLLRKKRLVEFATIVPSSRRWSRAHRASSARGGERGAAHRRGDAPAARGLERYTSKKIRLRAAVDPALLGGALVRIGDRVIDRTVQHAARAHRRTAVRGQRLVSSARSAPSCDNSNRDRGSTHVLQTGRSERRPGAGTRTLRGQARDQERRHRAVRGRRHRARLGPRGRDGRRAAPASRATSWAWC